MHILILICNTGAGHNSAAAAIREEFELHNDTCVCMDALRLESTEFSKLICAVHSLTYRYMPKLYGAGYEKEEAKTVSWVGRLLIPAAKKLHTLLQSEAFDAVICVHAFAALIVTQMRKQYADHLPAFFVATDYTCSPYVAQCDMDGFFIPHPELAEEFQTAGIPEEKLFASGIPVRNAFQKCQSKKDARIALNLPENGQLILLASGSIGCGPLTELYTTLGNQLSEDAIVVVICGNNRRLVKKLSAIPVRTHSQILGFTDQISTYMDASDCFVTKAGGISTTEAMAKGKAIVLLNAVGGCEAHNYRFMTNLGYLGAETVDDTIKLILSGQYENKYHGKSDWLKRELLWQKVWEAVQDGKSHMQDSQINFENNNDNSISNFKKNKEILSTGHRVEFYIQCYKKLGYDLDSVDKAGQNYVISLKRQRPQSMEEYNIEQSVDKKLRLIELADRKQTGFLMMFINLAIHVVLFCVQGAVFYALRLDGAHPKIMLQIGVILFWVFLAGGLIIKLREFVGWKKAIKTLEMHLYDMPEVTSEKEAFPYVLSVLFTRNHGVISDLIYWCTGR